MVFTPLSVLEIILSVKDVSEHNLQALAGIRRATQYTFCLPPGSLFFCLSLNSVLELQQVSG